ncbi:thioredoxin [Solitalea longa]|uniref:Thioredoxin n=1 Tax=Solitalea longa TaxID=2079460 RepID=A0A2S5A708_9SPHI|nr:TlpA disulfide reductase family protein [Solitalea longa]POY37893.1 thioredoxin [Solitalea longa]
MKLNIKSVCLALIICLSITNVFGQQKPYTITATIKGLPDGTKMELIPGATHKDEKPVAEAVVAQGKFAFKGNLAEPRLFYIKTANAYGVYALMVQDGNITLSGHAKLSGNGENQFYSFESMVVKGSAAHTQFLQKRAPRERLDSIYYANDKANKDINGKLEAAHKSKDTVLVKSLKESEAYKQLEARESAFFDLAGKTISKIISDNKETWWGPFFALDLYSYFRPDDKPLYTMLSQQAKDSYYGKILKEELDPEGFKGKSAPLLDIKGEGNTDLASLLKGHKYVLVDFWASWCNPCRKSIPHLKKAYAELNDKGLQIVSISIDKKEADWVKAQGEEQLPWPSFLDKGTTANAWKVRAIPTMFLLDSKGTVVGEGLSLDELLAKVKAD